MISFLLCVIEGTVEAKYSAAELPINFSDSEEKFLDWSQWKLQG